MKTEDLKDLAYAKRLLENPGLAIKLANYLGYPVEMDHFQNMARGHFIVRRLERTYATENVQRFYTEL